MSIGTYITSYTVLPLCILAVSLHPGTTVAAGGVVAPHNPVSARFLTILPDINSFAFTPQDSGQKTQSPDDPLPDGKGKDETKKICGSCHSTNMWSGQRHTREEWSSVIDSMIAKGLEATDAQIETINTYLATYLGPPPKKDAPADSNK